MFLRRTERKKNGKAHSYWNVVENKRLDDGRVVQRHVLYLGEINSSQAAAWRKAIEVFDEDAGRTRTLALFPEDRCEAVVGEASIVQLRLSEMQLRRPRQWGACWLAGQLWRELQLDRFWADRLPPSRKGTPWDQILQVLASYRLIAPGSEWRLHREWVGNSAMADLLGADFGVAGENKLYACHDVLLYDLTSTYFEVNASDLPEGSKRRHGYSRDKRPDCPQVVIALVVTPDGLPLAYEVLPGNTADSKTLRTFLGKIEQQYGKARRVWVMDRGVPTEAVLAEMRNSDPPVQYLVGTPKGRLNRLEKHLLQKPWQDAREGVKVKLLAEDGELYVFAQSHDRVTKERAMRRRQLKWLWKRLRQIAAMEISREELLMKLGGARSKARPHGVWSMSRSTRSARASRSRSIARNCERPGVAKAVIYCAPISPRMIPRSSGNTTRSSSPSKRRSAISKATWRSVRSSIRTKSGSKPTSSSPFWLIACRSRSRAGFMLWRLG